MRSMLALLLAAALHAGAAISASRNERAHCSMQAVIDPPKECVVTLTANEELVPRVQVTGWIRDALETNYPFTVENKFGSWSSMLREIVKVRGAGESYTAVRLFDRDGCEATQVDELEEGGTVWVVVEGFDETSFDLLIDSGLGELSAIRAVSTRADSALIAEQICKIKDICLLRQFAHADVEALVQSAILQERMQPGGVRNVSIFDLEGMLGEIPANWTDLTDTHAHHCVACKELSPKGGYLRGPSKPAARIGTEMQLFVDYYAISENHGCMRVFEQAQKLNDGKPVLYRDRPWERSSSFISPTVSVAHDGSKFKLWYRPWPHAVAYAESVDGIVWVKPNLQRYDSDRYLLQPGRGDVDSNKASPEGFWEQESFSARLVAPTMSTREALNAFFHAHERGHQNNIISGGPRFSESENLPYLGALLFTVLFDESERHAQHRYKALYRCSEAVVATCLATSPDGLSFTPLNDGKPVTGRAADTYSNLIWNPMQKAHEFHTRTDFSWLGGWREIRGLRALSNRDIIADPAKWKTKSEWYLDLKGKKEKDRRQVYYLTTTVYLNIHFAFVGIIQFPRDIAEGGLNSTMRHERDVMDVYLATSRDGVRWELDSVYNDQPLIERGAEGEWDNDQMFAIPSMITRDGQHWIFYLGGNERHEAMHMLSDIHRSAAPHQARKNGMGTSVLQLDRFAYLQPNVTKLQSVSDLAFITTVPFALEGERFTVNAQVLHNSSLHMAILDETNTVIDGFSQEEFQQLQAVDGHSLVCKWKTKTLSELKHRTVRIRMYMRAGCKLYGFQIHPQ